MPQEACGILLLDKPLGLSSNAALQRVRHALGRPKAGHTGALDPLATGMLPLCIGEATKVAGDLLEGNKAYRFTARLGARTSTGDAEGAVVATAAVAPSSAELEALLRKVLPQFLGPQRQVPPMYSALKRDGQPLYKLAREGIEVERPARDITIHELELLGVEGNDSHWRVLCSKGTYIRVLAEDLARAAGTLAHLVALRRDWAAPFEGLPLQPLEQILQDPGSAVLWPPETALPHLPAVHLDPGDDALVAQGRQLRRGAGGQGRVRMHAADGRFLGVGEWIPGGWLQPRRVLLTT